MVALYSGLTTTNLERNVIGTNYVNEFKVNVQWGSKYVPAPWASMEQILRGVRVNFFVAFGFKKQ